MVFCHPKVSELKKAVGAKKLGTYPAIPGWRYNGKAFDQVEFERNDKVRYLSGEECIAVFQDMASLDD